MRRKYAELEKNQIMTSQAIFIEMYNKNIPATYPQATIKNLNKFRAQNASLFANANEWSIDKHRKKVMDWLSVNENS